MGNCWDDLPDGSVVMVECMHGVETLTLDSGQWWLTPDELGEIDPAETYTVIRVPVTDIEPPVGSIVEMDNGSIWMRGLPRNSYVQGHYGPKTVWVELGRASIGHMGLSDPWPHLRPHVTRILRWGE